MKYKVGDKVKIKSLDWYNQNKDAFGFIFCNNICFDEKMTEFCGKTVTIAAQRNENHYFIMEDNCLSFWSEDMIEGLADEPQDKMVSLDKVCDLLYSMLTTQDLYDYDYVTAPAYDTVEDFVEDFRKSFEK